MLGHDHLHLQQYKPMWGVGHHLLGAQIFDYRCDPWGRVHEHWTDSDRLNVEVEGRTLPREAASRSQWGLKAPREFMAYSTPQEACHRRGVWLYRSEVQRIGNGLCAWSRWLRALGSVRAANGGGDCDAEAAGAGCEIVLTMGPTGIAALCSRCPLAGVERTSAVLVAVSPFDPNPTFKNI